MSEEGVSLFYVFLCVSFRIFVGKVHIISLQNLVKYVYTYVNFTHITKYWTNLKGIVN